MELEEDMIMIIVGDGTQDYDPIQPLNIKQEDSDGAVDDALDSEQVEHYLAAAERYGEVLDFKQEVEDDTEPHDSDEDYLEDFEESDEEYLVEKTPRKKAKTVAVLRKSIQNTSKKKKTSTTPKSKKKETSATPKSKKKETSATPKSKKEQTPKVPPKEIKSYVQSLLQEQPELKSDQKKLIEILANIMQNTKPPPPPDGYYEFDPATGIYSCMTCDHTFTTPGNMARHYQIYHGERYMVCFACGETYRGHELYRHEKRCRAPDAPIVLRARAIAVGARGRRRPFLPPQVKKKKKTYKPEPGSLQCSYCPRSFLTKRSLESHENLHRGERPYVCDYCMAPYGSYAALVRHRHSHQNLQFICDHCGKVFRSKVVIIEHLESHNPIRKYGCDHCDKRFPQRITRDLHIRRQHLGLPPPLACQLCPKRFGRMSHLKPHMKRAHGMDIITKAMLIKKLPTLTEMELQQAKVMLKSDIQEFPPLVVKSTGKQNKKKTTVTSKNQQTDTPKKQLTITPKKQVTVTPKNQLIVTPKTEQTVPSSVTTTILNVAIPRVLKKDEPEEIRNNNQQKVIVESNDQLNSIAEVKSDDSEESENQIIVDISDTDLSAEVLQFVQKLQAEHKEKVVLLDHGQIVHLVDNENDAMKLVEVLKVRQGSVEVEDLSTMQKQLIENVETQDTYFVETETTETTFKDNNKLIIDEIEAQLQEMEEDNPSIDSKPLHQQNVLKPVLMMPRKRDVEKKELEDILSEDTPMDDDKKDIKTATKSTTPSRNEPRQYEIEIVSPKPKPRGRKRKIEVEIEITNEVKKESSLRRFRKGAAGPSMPDLT